MAKYLSQPRIENPIWLEKDEISFLQAKISDTETEIKSLENDKSDLTKLQCRKNELEKLKNILSPIRRVPLDVLSEIFDLCSRNDGSDNWPKDIDTVVRYTPLVLASVCVAWKTTVYDTPKIWSVLYLRLGDTRGKDQDWVQRWLSRSRGLPLELHLFHGRSISFLERTRNIMDTILRFRHQIQILDFWGSPGAILALFHLPSSSLPLLAELSLTLERDIITRPVTWEIAHGPSSDKMKFLLGCPALRDVKIVECQGFSFLSESLIPFEQLTSLKIKRANHRLNQPDLIVNLLQRCGNIVVLELHLPSGPQFYPGLPILLPLLQSLAIRTDGDDMGPLRLISAPSLKDLSLSWAYNITGNFRRICEEVVDFQRHRSSSTLSSLIIRDIIGMSKEVVRMLLSAFPSVKLFRTVNVTSKHDLFQCLTLKGSKSMPRNSNPTAHEAILLPHLTHLEVLGPYLERQRRWERQLLCDMMRSRWWTEADESGRADGLCRLQKVTFDQESKVYPSELAGLAGLVDVTVLPD